MIIMERRLQASAPFYAPFWSACSNGRLQEVRVLAHIGADLEEVGGHDQCTPLFAAVYRRHEEVVEFLLNKKVDVQSKNKYGNTPLHVACASGFGSDAIIKLLLANGAKCDVRNNTGETPAHYAAHSGQPSSLKTLIFSGADATITDNKGFTVLHSATQRWLCSEDEDEDDFQWMVEDNRNVVRVLLDNYRDVWATIAALKAETNDGYTAEELTGRFSNNGFSKDGVIKNMLVEALKNAEETRMVALTAFAMGNHMRLGVSSTVFGLGTDEIRLILDHV